MGLPKRIPLLFFVLPVFVLWLRPAFAQQNLSGQVTTLGKPLAGVNVRVLDTPTGTVTDAQGRYQIQAHSGQILRFSFVGYQTVEVVVDEMNQTLNISLYEAVNNLEEVTVQKERATEPGVTPMGKPAKMETNFGIVDVERAGYAINYVSGEKLNYAHEFVHRALVGKIPNYKLIDDIPPKVVLRGKNSINLDNSAIWEIDGVIYTDNPPLINVSDVKEVYVIQGLAGTVKYGTLGAGGVIVVKTKLGDIKSNSNHNTKKTDNYTNKDYYQNDALPYNQYTEYEPFYLKSLDSLVTAEHIYHAYTESGDNLKADAYYGLAVTQKLYQEFGANTYAKKITETVRDRHADNPEVLKSLAYLLQTEGQYEQSLPIYRKLLALRPDYAQSYRDLANGLVETNGYRQAWKTYMQYLNKTGKLTEAGIDKVVFDEMQNLFTLHRHELPHKARMEKFDVKEVQQDLRLVFEWNVADAEFELEFVNPNRQVFSFNHTYRDNNPLLIAEKKQGYSTESFFIESLQGNWQVNLTYHGNGKYDPTYLKMTTFYNWGSATQRQETLTFRLLQTGMKFNLIKVSQTSLASNK
ncbi:MAG: carboxypeptidase-like regulatory domain-containing protein [Flavobacteriaceae bacterium]|nr:carboxypeptidase-like regulatory domain-containing protein [Flavobacteriaceae bacterium]